jgi:hypothetical protein
MIERASTPGTSSSLTGPWRPSRAASSSLFIDGEFTVKRYHCAGGRCFLLAENPRFSPIEVTEDMAAEVWGVVSYVIHKV